MNGWADSIIETPPPSSRRLGALPTTDYLGTSDVGGSCLGGSCALPPSSAPAATWAIGPGNGDRSTYTDAFRRAQAAEAALAASESVTPPPPAPQLLSARPTSPTYPVAAGSSVGGTSLLDALLGGPSMAFDFNALADNLSGKAVALLNADTQASVERARIKADADARALAIRSSYGPGAPAGASFNVGAYVPLALLAFLGLGALRMMGRRR